MIAGLLFAAFVITYLALMAAAEYDYRHPQPADQDTDRSHTGESPAASGCVRADLRGSAPVWLPATLPAPPVTLSPSRRPRISAGRVAPLMDLITLCDPAGWPVASYAAGIRWPAQEGTA